MRALVTGGAGFIGSALVRDLLADGAEVLVVDDLSVGQAVPTPGPGVTVVTEAVDSPAAGRAVAEFEPDTVFHLAALHFILWCERHPEATHHANVESTSRLLDLLRVQRPARVLFASSMAVYGFRDEPTTEQAPRSPSNVYATTKVLGEDLMTGFAAEHPACTVAMPRLANVYGPGDLNDHLIPSLCHDLGGEIRLGNRWPQRDYVHVLDVVSAMRRLADLPAGVHTYNVGTGVGTTVDVIVDTLTELSGVPRNVVPDPARQRRDDGHLVADSTALQRATSWRPQVDLTEGLADVLRNIPDHTPTGVR
ncbi:MAG: NAD-dependent epimerase/dehydratase family protein [Streptosporangiales bacterium]|nr:NAD-dependent epimerase/dehydratase family protein [Streptosporangiales bacterium]